MKFSHPLHDFCAKGERTILTTCPAVAGAWLEQPAASEPRAEQELQGQQALPAAPEHLPLARRSRVEASSASIPWDARELPA